MKEIGTLIVVAILVVLKLIITGMCLAIGFKLGYLVIESLSNKNKVIKNDTTTVA